MLNRGWHRECSKVELYAHHLSRCPSFALTNNVITGPFRRNDLLRLKTKFATEVRRNLFEAYLRPRKTLVNLISVSASSSTAFPVGEAFRFAFSPNGQTVLALTSSRIYVLDLTSEPIRVLRELKTTRRALAASITDDGSLLAVLSSKHQVNIYGLAPNRIQHLQVIVLDNPPRTIALAHEGTVLSTAYDTGIEVFSLAANALSTDRRAVRCEAVDCLDFSGDGSMLIGSSRSPDDPNAVVISAPYYAENDPDISPRELHSRQWTTQILFPNNSATCSHTALIPNHSEGDAAWLFAFDHMLTTFRAVRTDDTRTGVAYFLSPPLPRRFSGLSFPSTPPAVSGCGDLVVAGFQNVGVALYGIPQRLDVSPDMGSVVERQEARMHGPMALTTATGNIEPLMAYSPSISGSSDSIEDDPLASRVDWRASLFVKSKPLKTITGVTALKWVERGENREVAFPGRRLVAAAPGGVNTIAEELGVENMPVDGGRLEIFDFDYSPAAPRHQEITIEVGNDEAEQLPEHQGNLEIEIAMERRRTVRDSGNRGNLGRSVTSITPPGATHPGQPTRKISSSQPSSPGDRFPSFQDIASQYSSAQPRSQDALQRSRTAAGINTARYPPRPPLRSQQDPDLGRRESNDSWTTPPPPYSSGRNSVPLRADLDSRIHRPPFNQDSSPLSSRGDTLPAIQASMQVPFPPIGANPHLLNGRPYRHFTEPSQQVTHAVHVPPRASTTIEAAPSQGTPAQRFGPPIDSAGHSFRAMDISGPSLETVTEFGSLGAATNFLPGSPSTVISPVSTHEAYFYPIRRRPVGGDDNSRSPDGMPRLYANITDPTSPPIADRPLRSRGQDPVSGPTDIDSMHPQDLSGSVVPGNIQDRLDKPVPPLPTIEDHLQDPGYIPPNLRVGQPGRPGSLVRDPNAEPFATVATPVHQVSIPRRQLPQNIPQSSPFLGERPMANGFIPPEMRRTVPDTSISTPNLPLQPQQYLFHHPPPLQAYRNPTTDESVPSRGQGQERMTNPGRLYNFPTEAAPRQTNVQTPSAYAENYQTLQANRPERMSLGGRVHRIVPPLAAMSDQSGQAGERRRDRGRKKGSKCVVM